MTMTREKLALEVDVAQWQWLRAHGERGALLVVDRSLDLAEVGERMAEDDTRSIQGWVEGQLLIRPTEEQVAAWESQPQKNFAVLIVSPFVLMQESR